MLDEQKLIAAESLIRSITASLPEVPFHQNELFSQCVRIRFDACKKIMEEYATIPTEEEWINTGVRVPKAYWDARDQNIIGPENRPQKTETGWFIHTQKKNIFEFKKLMEDKENGTTYQ